MKYYGMMRIRNEERWIGEVVQSLIPLCSKVFILDDHSTDRTYKICRSFGCLTKVIPSPFDVAHLDEARDKTFLLREIFHAGVPDWVIAIDGDEVLEKSADRKIRRITETRETVAVLRFKIEYVWNSPDKIRTDGIYGKFFRPSAFKLAGQPLSRLDYRTTGAGKGANLHCSNYPLNLRGVDLVTDVRIKHYGYMALEDRKAKFEYYNRIDPNNNAEDGYRHMMEIPGARYAPGPTVLEPWID